MVIPLRQELGKEPLWSIRLNNLKRTTFKNLTPVFNISLRILSGPGAFLGFSVFAMFSISEIEIGLSRTLWMSFVCPKVERFSLKEIWSGGRKEEFECECNCLKCFKRLSTGISWLFGVGEFDLLLNIFWDKSRIYGCLNFE